MNKKNQHNKGFTLIELLIAMAIFSIVMLMVVQFMSTTSGAYRKTKKNLNVQTEAQQVMEQISDTLMQANYIQVRAQGGKAYTIKTTQAEKGTDNRIVTEVSGVAIDSDFVPDNYPNYVKPAANPERQIIVNYDTYQLVGLESGTAKPYPFTGDYEEGAGVKSFRALKPSTDYYYIKPEYIYAEYVDGAGDTIHVIYYFSKSGTDDMKVYMHRYKSNNKMDIFSHAKGLVDAACTGSKDGFVTSKIKDFYLSADVEGGALLTNVMFENDGYQYNAVETIKFRNSNVLTVRPQKLYKLGGTGEAVTP